MWCLAANLLLGVSVTAVPPVQPYDTIADSILSIGGIQRPDGVAVLIDDSGLFLAANQVTPTVTLSARARWGQDFTVRVIARDEVSQLALLKAQDWPRGRGKPIRVVGEEDRFSQLLAITPHGAVSGMLSSSNRTGIISGSRRYVRLWEIRLESTPYPLGGAPVFTLDGRLAGILNATLEPIANAAPAPMQATPGQPLAMGQAVETQSRFGPQGLTVGYVLGPKILRRVVDGFLSEDRVAKHPTVGLLFRSRSQGGVELTSVTEGSAADEAGLKVGDAVLRVNGEPVRDAVHLATRLFESEIGESLTFQIQRGSVVQSVAVRVESLGEAKRRDESALENLHLGQSAR